MSGVAVGLTAQLVLAGLGVAAALAAPAHRRNQAAGGLAVLLGLAGAGTGAQALGGANGRLDLPLVALADARVQTLSLAPDRLGGLFILITGVVGVLTALFAIGYAQGAAGSRTAWSAFVLFLLGMQLVPAAGDVVAFLLAWEVMAAASTVLVLCEHASRAGVRSAGLRYAVMTHLSFLGVLAGMAVLASSAGSTGFDQIARSGVPAGTAGLAFVLLTLGFATKAGLVPLHVWLPRAHPQAPGHVSAAMSAAMVKLGVYGVLLTVTRLLPDGARWWGLLLLALALPSALYGILQASVASDLKRLLAYSTTENVGLILSAAAISLLAREAGATEVAEVALIAALMLAISHAAFKTVLFLGAGAIVHATGERDLDRLGGLGAGMPVTAATFGIAALGAAALPVSSGFAAEWVFLQALIHGNLAQGRLFAALLPVTIGVVALTAGLALLTFVKAYGIAFLARPRSAGAAAAHEVSWSMRAAMILGAGAVLGLGLFPGVVARAAAGALGSGTRRAVRHPRRPADRPRRGGLDPAALTGLGLALTVPVVLASWQLSRRRHRRAVELPWGCGGVRLDPRMQYTATSFAEPLVRVFDDALQPSRDLHVTHAEESRYLVEGVRFSQSVTDLVEQRVYRPAIVVLDRVSDAARAVHNGSIHRYLGFSFAALVVVLLAVSR